MGAFKQATNEQQRITRAPIRQRFLLIGLAFVRARYGHSEIFLSVHATRVAPCLTLACASRWSGQGTAVRLLGVILYSLTETQSRRY